LRTKLFVSFRLLEEQPNRQPRRRTLASMLNARVAERARVAFRVLGRSRTSARLLGVSSSMTQLDELDPIMPATPGAYWRSRHRAHHQ
jgi:hypothetical protein